MIDFDNMQDLDIKLILNNDINPLEFIANILHNNKISFDYSNSDIVCYNNDKSSEDIISIIRTNFPSSLIILRFLINVIVGNNYVRFKNRRLKKIEVV